MQTQMFAPRGSLIGVVEAFWAGEVRDAEPRIERILPSGTTELVVDLRDERRGALVCGPGTQPFLMQRSRRESIVGVHFVPGGAAAFLGVPADELRDGRVPLEALWGGAARALRERLLDAPSAPARVRVLEQALLARAPVRSLRHESVTLAVSELARVSAARPIAQIAAASQLSSRHFIARFAAQVGLTPKRFARVRRFQAVIERAEQAARAGWTQVALDCGYYDQAHLIRDFRDFAALAPGEYLRLRSHDPNHVPHVA